MGKALYRKYRSRGFDELVGQEHITTTLKNAIKNGNVSHAYLFTGPRGVGKTSVARILAHAINNLPYEEDINHLDIIEIDAASNRRIDEIRDLREKVHIAPTSANYKVYIIDEVHMLTKEAFNALLKTLEEPPAHVIFILATTEVHKLPDTIVSRTQHFAFRPYTLEEISKHLIKIAKKESIDIETNAIARIAAHGQGSFRDSISMLDQLKYLGKKVTLEDVELLLGLPADKLLDDIVESLRKNDRSMLLNLIEHIRTRGIDVATLAKSLSDYIYSDMLQDTKLLNPDHALVILRELLQLTGSNRATHLHLEVALLSSLLPLDKTPNSTKHKKEVVEQLPAPTTSTSKPEPDQPKQTSEVTEVVSDSKSEEYEEAPIATPTQQSELWGAILQDVKSKHNTLYGILRMATVRISDDSITLTFRFAFHKKQIDQPKNQEIISNFIKKHYGTTLVINSIVLNDTKQLGSKPTPLEKKDILSDISNIFGGAELLE
jgi:DNA polymerase-3 subunit gamma/tau